MKTEETEKIRLIYLCSPPLFILLKMTVRQINVLWCYSPAFKEKHIITPIEKNENFGLHFLIKYKTLDDKNQL